MVTLVHRRKWCEDLAIDLNDEIPIFVCYADQMFMWKMKLYEREKNEIISLNNARYFPSAYQAQNSSSKIDSTASNCQSIFEKVNSDLELEYSFEVTPEAHFIISSPLDCVRAYGFVYQTMKNVVERVTGFCRSNSLKITPHYFPFSESIQETKEDVSGNIGEYVLNYVARGQGGSAYICF